MQTINDVGVPLDVAAAKLAVLTGRPVDECELDLLRSIREFVMPSKAARREVQRLGIEISS